MHHNPRICVYTCLIGDYELLNEQPDHVRGSADFFCFTDVDRLSNDTWDIVKIKPAFPEDATRSQRSIKILQHPIIDQYDYSIYIDNSVMLSVPAEEIIQTCLAAEYDIALSRHSFRERVLDEFQAVSDLAYAEQGDLLKQLEAYAAYSPEVLSQRPFWCGMIVRKQRVDAVEQLMKDWFHQVLLYSRRDQLSFNFALSNNSVRLSALTFNNNQSPIHSWPHARGRRKSVTLADMAREIKDAKAVSNLLNTIDRAGVSQRRLAGVEDAMRLPCSTLQLQAGSNYAGAGGEVSFGVAEFPDALPMASIAGSLDNAWHTQTQGALSFRTRSVGGPEEQLVERMRINSDGSITLMPVSGNGPRSPGTLRYDPVHGLLLTLDGQTWLKVNTTEIEP